jgi:hypothetical protein
MTEKELAAALFKLRVLAPELFRSLMHLITAALRTLGTVNK